MSETANPFGEGAKVVISPDQMRAWISLPKPRGVTYTVEAVLQWLPQNGVVYGVDTAMVQAAVSSGRYDDLLEVARGTQPVAAQGGDYVLKVEKRPFTGLSAGPDGALIYDDISFLQEVQPGQLLAEIVPASPAAPGRTVTGEEVAPRKGGDGRQLSGSGFELSADGRSCTSPTLGHVSIVGDQLIVTPLKKLAELSAEDGPVAFDGNVLVEGDVLPGAQLSATGSIFVAGRAVAASITAGNNLLLCQGLRAGASFGHAEAKENLWGLFFESANLKAGGDLCTNYLSGCDAVVGGRATILGGRALIAGTTLQVKGSVLAGTIGTPSGDVTAIVAGMDQAFIDRYDSVTKRAERLASDLQVLMQNISAHERVNRAKADRGKNDTAYKEMVQKRDQSLSVLNILEAEKTRLKRTMDSFSTLSIIARETVYPGVTISIDTRTLKVVEPLPKVKFRRNKELVEYTPIGAK
ncbi:MAG: DUF342 domain-containing protein [Oscillospiraceae bacterium]